MSDCARCRGKKTILLNGHSITCPTCKGSGTKADTTSRQRRAAALRGVERREVVWDPDRRDLAEDIDLAGLAHALREVRVIGARSPAQRRRRCPTPDSVEVLHRLLDLAGADGSEAELREAHARLDQEVFGVDATDEERHANTERRLEAARAARDLWDLDAMRERLAAVQHAPGGPRAPRRPPEPALDETRHVSWASCGGPFVLARRVDGIVERIHRYQVRPA